MLPRTLKKFQSALVVGPSHRPLEKKIYMKMYKIWSNYFMFFNTISNYNLIIGKFNRKFLKKPKGFSANLISSFLIQKNTLHKLMLFNRTTRSWEWEKRKRKPTGFTTYSLSNFSIKIIYSLSSLSSTEQLVRFILSKYDINCIV